MKHAAANVRPLLGLLGLVLLLLWSAAANHAAAQNPDELQRQLDQARAQNEQLKKTLAQLEAKLAKTMQMTAELQAEKDQLGKEMARLQEELAARVQSKPGAATTAEAAAGSLAALRKEVETLRAEIRKAQEDRDKNLQSVVGLTDQLHQAFSELKQLKELNARLCALMPAPATDVAPPPRCAGLVVSDPIGALVEISLGADDGLRPGHSLEIFRLAEGKPALVGRVLVLLTAPDMSVCKVDPKSLKGPIQKGDRVSSKTAAQTPAPVDPPAPGGQPSLVDGLVLEVAADGQVEISFGADDGLAVGHRLEVYRLRDGQGIYIGRIEVVRTAAKRAVCKSIPELQRDTIRKDDRVASSPR